MRIAARIFFGTAILLIVALVAAWLLLPRVNDRQTSGELVLSALDAPVRIVRDANAVPYIYAESMDDALRAQGFVAGQDRLFQLEAAKRAATGRLSEVLGPGDGDVILNLDRESRVIGFHRIAARQEAILTPASRNALKSYLEGLNAYIESRSDSHPMEFGLAGFVPEIWSETDLLAVAYFLGWGSAANFDAELIAHRVIQAVGEERFEEIAPLVVNPDDIAEPSDAAATTAGLSRWAGPTAEPAGWTHRGWRENGHGGSNNWAMSGSKSGNRAAIVTNDPHLDSRLLPGPWHPVGLITPEMRVVGVSAGLPGVVIGRNAHLAFGVTNAYADAIDLYVETVDPDNPDNYLEGDTSIPFTVMTETIRIKDEAAPNGIREEQLVVRATRRGPVITDREEASLDDAVLSVRWAAAEYMDGDLGLDRLMLAETIEQALAAVESTRLVCLNFVVGDVTGRVARRASGVAPIRLSGDGMAPFRVVDDIDNWGGRIPAAQMPGEIDPERGWTGTANHMTAPDSYPYLYTRYTSPSFRYRRMRELFAAPKVTAEDAWLAQYDTLNVFARDIAPIFAKALSTAEDDSLVEMGTTLESWDHRDDRDALAPTLFQETVLQLARLTFEDELGSEATEAYLSNWYVWQERFNAMLLSGDSPWFDDSRTAETEDLAAMIRRAAKAALERLETAYGSDRANWVWGDVHQIRFQGPLRQTGWAGWLTGNRAVRMSGSGETLLRALYPRDDRFDSRWFASLRMTADLNDPEKVRAVLPGGAVGRTFHPHLADQNDDWASEDATLYWWFSDDAIEQHGEASLALVPSA
ncbi:MAG: penicillin acylase family protein [Pseudomonadota bacterium]